MDKESKTAAKKRTGKQLLTGILLCFSVFLPVFISACSVRIYDLQPIIVGTDTATPTTQTKETFAAVTPSPAIRSATATPPIHISPTEITEPISVNILDIAMIDGGTGWGIGQIPGKSDKMVLRTGDGAATWKNITPPEAIYDQAGKIRDIAYCFRDELHAWLMFYAPDGSFSSEELRVWSTEDGGQTWESSPLPLAGYGIQFFTSPQIGFLDSQTGWLFAHIGKTANREYIALYTTYDGGRNWNAMVTSDSGNLSSLGRKNGAVFRDTLEGWISSQNTAEEPDMILWHTMDGGNTWFKQPVPAPYGYNIPDGLLIDPSYTCRFSTPKFTDTMYQCAWAVLRCAKQDAGEPVSILYWTQDRLVSWKTLRLPAFDGDLSFYGIEYGWYAVSTTPGSDFPYEILFTEDGGENWRTASRLAWDSRLQFITPAVGFGIATYNGQPALVKTMNSGFSWEQIFPIVTSDQRNSR